MEIIELSLLPSSIYLMLYTTGCVAASQDCGNCVFPFIFSGREINTCTTIDGDSQPWCSTKTDDSGYHVQGNWEYCSSASCPGISSPEMYVHPSNSPGSCYCGVPNMMSG